MSPEDKKKRKDRVERVSTAKDKAHLAFPTMWFTRANENPAMIDVWLAPPTRKNGIWFAPDTTVQIMTAEGIHGPWVEQIDYKEMLSLVRVTPDTELECIRWGNADPNFIQE